MKLAHGEFVCLAPSPELAILRWWQHQGIKFAHTPIGDLLAILRQQREHPIGDVFEIDFAYYVHEGDSSRVRWTSSAVAWIEASASFPKQCCVAIDTALISKYGQKLFDGFIEHEVLA